MVRQIVIAAVVGSACAMPTFAQDADAKAVDCGHQASVVAAVQQARKDRVKERDVQAHVIESAVWPEKYHAVVPLIAGWVYSRDIKMRDIRNKDLGAAWKDICLQEGS